MTAWPPVPTSTAQRKLMAAMDHDHSYKLLFANPRMVEDLLRGFVHEAWISELDFGTLERVGGSYVTDDLREREDDIVWRLRRRGDWVYIYLLIEFQSRIDRYMALRMLAYVALLWQDLVESRQCLPNGKLPPVLPVVLYNGPRRWNAATEVSELIQQLPGGLAAYTPQMRHLVIDEGAFDDSELTPLKNLVAMLFRLEQIDGLDSIPRLIEDLGAWTDSADLNEVRRAFVVWLRRVLLPARLPGVEIPEVRTLQEMKAMLAERVVEWTAEWKRQGLEQGLEQGLDAERRLLLRLIRRRFGDGFVDRARDLLARVNTLEEMEPIAESVIDSDDGAVFIKRLRAFVDRA